MSFVNIFRKKYVPVVDEPSDDDGYDFNSEDEDVLVWDVPNPFAPPDPSQAHLHALIQAQVVQMRRYESIGPLQSLPDQIQLDSDYWDDSEDEDCDDHEDSDGDDHEDGDDDDHEDNEDEDSDDDDIEDSDDHEDDDGDDGDDEDSDDDTDAKPNTILLPQLLPIPLRFIPSPPSSDTPWTNLAQVYNDIAEAEERAARKAKRDAHRSRLKALAILGPEASSAI